MHQGGLKQATCTFKVPDKNAAIWWRSGHVEILSTVGGSTQGTSRLSQMVWLDGK